MTTPAKENSAVETGGPAFPSHGSMGEVTHEGMTLRDYFAAKAMQGWMASTTEADTCTSISKESPFIAEMSYAVADALLAARKQGD